MSRRLWRTGESTTMPWLAFSFRTRKSGSRGVASLLNEQCRIRADELIACMDVETSKSHLDACSFVVRAIEVMENAFGLEAVIDAVTTRRRCLFEERGIYGPRGGIVRA